MDIDEFYAECVALLGTIDECQAFPYHKRTRWNNRVAGRGRYPGFGIIRAFGSTVHIHLHHPCEIIGVFDGFDTALDHLHQNLT